MWFSLATGMIVAGLVDGSAVIEARRGERSVLDLAGDRVGRIQVALIHLVHAVFTVGEVDAADLATRLRESTQAT